MDFRLDTSTGESIGVAVMPERLDITNSRQLKSSFQQWMRHSERMVFDCSQLGFLDSSGLGAIIHCLRISIVRGVELKLSGLVLRVMMVFELTRANQLFSIYPDLTGAMESYLFTETQAASVR
jgi:anti-sigma B factor antagonist